MPNTQIFTKVDFLFVICHMQILADNSYMYNGIKYNSLLVANHHRMILKTIPLFSPLVVAPYLEYEPQHQLAGFPTKMAAIWPGK